MLIVESLQVLSNSYTDDGTVDLLTNAIREIEQLREQLRRRKWPDEKPEHDQVVIHQGKLFRYDANTDDAGASWDNGQYSEKVERGDRWLPVPQDKGSDV